MKNILPILCVSLALSLFSSCLSQSKPPLAGPDLAAVFAQAGWEIGGIYKTQKRGGVTLLGGGYYALESEHEDPRVKEAWQNNSYQNKWFSHRVEKGTMFKVTSISKSGQLGNFFVRGIQLPPSPSRKTITLSFFCAGTSDFKLPDGYGWIARRDPDFLVPVSTPSSVEMPAPSGKP
jgi:hypothetical protein